MLTSIASPCMLMDACLDRIARAATHLPVDRPTTSIVAAVTVVSRVSALALGARSRAGP